MQEKHFLRTKNGVINIFYYYVNIQQQTHNLFIFHYTFISKNNQIWEESKNDDFIHDGLLKSCWLYHDHWYYFPVLTLQKFEFNILLDVFTNNDMYTVKLN